MITKAGQTRGYSQETLWSEKGRILHQRETCLVKNSYITLPLVRVQKSRSLTQRISHRKQEIASLLESGGFSRSNPYYIVQQGKINALTLMKDADRLEIIKEVAGTRVYEEKKKEANKIIQDADVRKQKVHEILDYVDERLSELDKERAELSRFQKLDKKRRAIEFCIYEKQRQAAFAKIAQVRTSFTFLFL